MISFPQQKFVRFSWFSRSDKFPESSLLETLTREYFILKLHITYWKSPSNSQFFFSILFCHQGVATMVRERERTKLSWRRIYGYVRCIEMMRRKWEAWGLFKDFLIPNLTLLCTFIIFSFQLKKASWWCWVTC